MAKQASQTWVKVCPQTKAERSAHLSQWQRLPEQDGPLMSQEEFVIKWRGELFALIFEAEAAGLRAARMQLLNRSETILRSIYTEMNVPPGPVPPKVLACAKELFNTIQKELAPIVEKLKIEVPKILPMVPFDAPDERNP